MNKFLYYENLLITGVKILYSALSVCLIIGTLFICVFWLLDSEYYYQIRPSNHQIVKADTSGQVFNTNLLIIGSGKAQYTQWIEDLSHHTVYEYDKLYINSYNESNVHQSIMHIPALPEGQYIVKGELYYQANPLKTSRLSLELGTITAK